MTVLRLFDLDCPRLGFLDLGQHQGENAVIQLGCDLVLVDLAGEPEAARIVTHVVLGVERLQSLIFGEIQPALDFENAVLDADIDAVFIDPWHFQHDVQRVVGLVDVRRRQEYAGRNRRLLLLFQFAFLLHLQILSRRHDHAPDVADGKFVI
jgi:hypothetical protein